MNTQFATGQAGTKWNRKQSSLTLISHGFWFWFFLTGKCCEEKYFILHNLLLVNLVCIENWKPHLPTPSHPTPSPNFLLPFPPPTPLTVPSPTHPSCPSSSQICYQSLPTFFIREVDVDLVVFQQQTDDAPMALQTRYRQGGGLEKGWSSMKLWYYELVSYGVFWAESTTKDYITAKNNVQSVSYLLCMQVIKP